MANRSDEIDLDISESLCISEIVLEDQDLLFDVTFISDEEIHEFIGLHDFGCGECGKEFKSKKGLNMHLAKTHGNTSNIAIEEEQSYISDIDFSTLVTKVLHKVTVEGIFPEEIRKAFPTALPGNLCGVLSVLAQKFLATKRPELIALAKEKDSAKKDKGKKKPICFIKEEERGPLAYVMGAVISKLYKKSAYGHSTSLWKEQIESLFTGTLRVPIEENSYLSELDRGGLWNPSEKLLRIAEKIEMKFRVEVQKKAKTIPIKEIINDVLSDSTVVSVWDSIILDHEGAEVDQDVTLHQCPLHVNDLVIESKFICTWILGASAMASLVTEI
eukprot:gene11289-21481_t